mgnify:CR=1 FL=1
MVPGGLNPGHQDAWAFWGFEGYEVHYLNFDHSTPAEVYTGKVEERIHQSDMARMFLLAL